MNPDDILCKIVLYHYTEGSEERQYVASLFYISRDTNTEIHRDIYFVVTWNMEAHLTVREFCLA